MKRLALSLLCLLCLMVPASSQNVTVIGPVTPGNCTQFNSTTVIKDAGTVCGSGVAITALTGDATATGPGSVPLTLATVLGTPGTFGSATQCVTNTVNAKGLTTAISATTCTPALGSITGLGTGVGTALGVNTNASGGIITAAPTRAGDILFWNGSAWTTLAGNNSGTQVLQETAAGAPSWSSASTGTVTSVTCGGVAIIASGTCPPTYGFTNCAITASVASNNLTVTLTDNAGATPSATSPCNIYYRNATQATGSWTQVTTTAATIFTANSGSTFGSTNTVATCSAAASCPFKLWVVAINSGSGTVLGVVDLTNASGVSQVLNEGVLTSTTACSSCATATSLGTIYSTAAQTSKPFIILGYLEWGSGLATAGTYASAPTAIQTLGPGVPHPGAIIQNLFTFSNTATTGTAAFAVTVPSLTMTPTMASNIIEVDARGTIQQSATSIGQVRLYRAAGSSAACTTGLNAASIQNNASNGVSAIALLTFDALGSVAQQTYVVCMNANAAGGAYNFQGTTPNTATIRIMEIMG